MCDFKKKEMVWNGNELVFSDNPNFGVAGIGIGVDEDVAKEIAKRWNEKSLQIAEEVENKNTAIKLIYKLLIGQEPITGFCEDCNAPAPVSIYNNKCHPNLLICNHCGQFAKPF